MTIDYENFLKCNKEIFIYYTIDNKKKRQKSAGVWELNGQNVGTRQYGGDDRKG